MRTSELTPDRLYHRCDPGRLPFETTDDVDPAPEPLGQPRAAEALRFGIGIDRDGYNIFALGEAGTGKYTLVRRYLDRHAAAQPPPPDVCYVNNFEDDHKPRVLTLPPGQGKTLKKEMAELVENVSRALRTAFENEDYQNRRESINQEFQEKQKEAFEGLRERAEAAGLALVRTPAGLTFAPVRDGEVMSPEELQNVAEDQRRELEEKIQGLQAEARRIFQQVPKWQREIADRQKSLDREVSRYAVGPVIDELTGKYEGDEAVVKHLKAVEADIVENLQSFRPTREDPQNPLQQVLRGQAGKPPRREGGNGSEALQKYQVNLLVDNGDTEGAPVVHEENPTYQNLMGRVEHLAHMGTLMTNFTMIRSGSLHRANGGYLILDAVKVLREPFAWEGLKRALRSGQVRVESIGRMYGMISTVALEPEPLPLNVKVVLTGPPMVYYLMRHHDPEFGRLFKVAADFARQVDRTVKNQDAYAGLIAGAVRKEKLKPFDSAAVARVIEHSARMAGDGSKLSLHMQDLTSLLREADYWASEGGNGRVVSADVQKAIDARVYRSDRLRERMQDQIGRGVVFVDTDGERVGQVNGLSVILLGDYLFGRPSRITARVSLGKGDVVDIEREVATGGPLHAKGVLILAGYLKGRYAADQPLSLSASLVFEQSYGGVDGDSASSAELYALLSAVSRIPVRQSLAVTGSVDQHGRVQPIGGVNEKIEGFYDTCRTRGITGDQGVLIPASNVQHLMLRRDVVDAVEAGRFHVYPVRTVDEGVELLTGVPAGEPDENGRFPENTVNGAVHRRLSEMTRRRLALLRPGASGEAF